MKKINQTLIIVFISVVLTSMVQGQYTNPKTNYLILGSTSTTNTDYIGYSDAGISGLTTRGVFHFQADVATAASVTNPTAGISIIGTYSPSTLRVKTASGYIDVGAKNTDWAHIYTDRPNFIFNKPVYSMNGFHSYNNHLTLQAASRKYVQIKPGSNSSYGLIIREHNSNDYGNFEVTSSGLGIGYNTSGSHMTINKNGTVCVGTVPTSTVSKFHVAGKTTMQGNSTSDMLAVINKQPNVESHMAVIWGCYGWSVPQSANPKLLDLTQNSNHRLIVRNNGQVGINCDPGNSSYELSVNGEILCEKIRVTASVPTSDYVFSSDYNLRPLSEVETFVEQNSHLPEVPSAAEFQKDGYDVGEMDDLLLRKIEELTLYIIEQDKRIQFLSSEVSSLKAE